MLRFLDTLIGFAVVMAVVSLLITVVTQMVSALLGLRGKYLAEGLESMIHKIDPSINDELHSLGKQLAKWILTHPIISDSLLSMRPSVWDKFVGLRWLRSRWRLASAIRPDELLRIVEDIAGVPARDAVVHEQAISELARAARAAIQDPARRATISLALRAAAEKVRTFAEEGRAAAAAAAENPGVASRQIFADAQLWSQRSTQAREIARKAAQAVHDDKTACRFADEAAMRAAAARLLAAVYVPERSPQLSANADIPIGATA